MCKKMDLRVLRLLGSCRVSRLLSGSFDAHMTRLEVAHVLIVVWGARAGVWCVCGLLCVGCFEYQPCRSILASGPLERAKFGCVP